MPAPAFLSPDELLKVQRERLRRAMAWCARIPHYQSHARALLQGSLSDLPPLTPEQLREAWPRLHEDGDRVVSIHASGGTIGRPKLIAYTDADWATSVEVTARSLAVAGVSAADRVAIAQPFGLWAIGSIFLEAVRSLGATALPWGIHLATNDMLALAELLRPTVIMAAPGALDRVTVDLESSGARLLHAIGTRRLILSGELLTSQTRTHLQRAWHALVVSLYGSAETDSLGVDCAEVAGHHVWADHFFLEIEGFGPLEPGQKPVEGVLLVSTLTRRATPLLRYRLGDAVRADWLPCACGITHPRVDVLGRSDQAFILSDGTTLQPRQIDAALAALRLPILAAQGVVRQESTGCDVLVIRVVPSGPLDRDAVRVAEDALGRLSIDVADAVAAGTLAPPRLELVSHEDLTRSARGKIVPIVDERARAGTGSAGAREAIR